MITTVVGSYPKIDTRAPSLRTAIARFQQGKISREELRRVEDEVTKEVLEEQARAGIDLVTDGQIRWEDGQTYFARRIQGFAINGLTRYFDTNTYYRQPLVVDKLRRQGPILVDDYRFAATHSSKPVKVVITGPYTLARLSQNSFYPDLKALVLELARILNQEARELEKAGAPVLQFDEPAILKYKQDFSLFREAAAVLTQGLSTTTVLCTYFADISGLYPHFLELPFGGFSLDFVQGKAHFDILQEFPQNKWLGLGIVDARNTRLETVEEIVAAVERISRVVPPERLYVHPSCGLEFLPRKNAFQKLVRMVEGVRRAQGEGMG